MARFRFRGSVEDYLKFVVFASQHSVEQTPIKGSDLQSGLGLVAMFAIRQRIGALDPC